MLGVERLLVVVAIVGWYFGNVKFIAKINGIDNLWPKAHDYKIILYILSFLSSFVSALILAGIFGLIHWVVEGFIK